MIEPIVVGKVELPQKVSAYFGENTFSEMIMQKMLSERTFKAFKRWQEEGEVISMAEADEIAHCMKEWAISKGACYIYTLVSSYDRLDCREA
jgi:glutamine synthetase